MTGIWEPYSKEWVTSSDHKRKLATHKRTWSEGIEITWLIVSHCDTITYYMTGGNSLVLLISTCHHLQPIRHLIRLHLHCLSQQSNHHSIHSIDSGKEQYLSFHRLYTILYVHICLFLVDSIITNAYCIYKNSIDTIWYPPIVECMKPSSWSLGGIPYPPCVKYFRDCWRKNKIQNKTHDSWYFMIHDFWFHVWTAFVSGLTHFCLTAHALATQALLQSKQQLLKASDASAIQQVLSSGSHIAAQKAPGFLPLEDPLGHP